MCLLASLFAFAMNGIAMAADDSVDYAYEYSQKIEAARAVPQLGDGLFGDHVDDYTGDVSFSVVDVNLPGNNSLPVQFARRYDTQSTLEALARAHMVGDWDYDIPHLHGVFSGTTGWVTETPGIVCAQPNKALAAPPTIAYGLNNLDSDIYWKGNQLYVPGQGDDELLHLDVNATNKPTDGSTYYWSTKGRWYFSCLSSMDGGTSKDAYLGQAPDGTKYWFDHLAARRTNSIYSMSRVENWILPTRVQDRFGNSVTYTYDQTNPWMLLSIEASDGRKITMNWTSGLTVSDGTRKWKYGFSSAGNLATVTLPDGSQWSYSNSGFGVPPVPATGFGIGTGDGRGGRRALVTSTGCGNFPWIVSPASAGGIDFIYYVTHPSGAKGTFTLNYRHSVRTYVPKLCGFSYVALNEQDSFDRYAPVFESLGITKKEVNGPGIPSTYTWSWSYPSTPMAPANVTTYDFQCTAGCATTKAISISQPDGSVVRNTVGVRYGVNEGKLLKSEILGTDGSTVLRTDTSDFLSSPVGQNYPSLVGDPVKLFNEPLTGVLTPNWRQQTLQQGVTFDWHVTQDSNGLFSFDSFANPLKAISSSTLGFSRTDTTNYYYDLNKWVLGQVASVTSGNTIISQTDYDPTTDIPIRDFKFGLLRQSMTYNPDGTLATVSDGNTPAHTTTLLSYFRGIPRKIKFADGSFISAAVNNSGFITGVTDEAGYATGYAYDPMGRLATITRPIGDTQADGTPIAWNPTTIVYQQMATTEYGIPSGHWKQIATTGQNQVTTYYDAQWRPLVTLNEDTASAATRSFVVKRYDSDGRLSFTSYPVGSLSSINDVLKGTYNTYDPLDRLTRQKQDSELGFLITNYDYLQGFQTQITNPRNKITTTSFQAFSSPDTSRPVLIASPLGVTTNITRDIFGKPLTLTRSGMWNGSPISETRSYVYDAYQRLCKRIEPETGATLLNYDGANNVLWSASGSMLTSTTTCDNSSPPSNAITRTYDPRDRLLTEIIPGSTNVGYGYFADGALKTLTSGTNTWTYTYNMRRLPLTEQLSIDDRTETITHAYDVLGHENSLTYPDGLEIAITPNALGQPSKAGPYATGVKYFPNGGMSGFTYHNGIVHTLTQNVRGLPLRSLDQAPSTAVLDDTYNYDENGNVTDIADGTTGNPNNRSMTYDALDRLTNTDASHQWWINATTSYDALDNIRTNRVGNTANYLNTYTYDPATWRVAGITGRSNFSLSYDANGNVASKGPGQDIYVFDAANRMQSVTGKESYQYDGYGRRVKVTRLTDNKTDYPVYTMSGQLLTEDDQRSGKTTDYISLSGSLVAKRSATIGSTAYITTYEHTDALYSPTVETDTTGRETRIERYTPYGEPSDGSYTQGPGFTGHVTDAATGLTYAQQRYYDPVLARFLSADPVPPKDTGVNFNRYWYANDNPYKFTDPDGRCTITHNASLCSLINSVRQGMGMENYSTQPGVVMTPALQNHASDVADTYHAQTNKTVIITSGVRTAAEQAKAMEYKITHGEGVGIYKNKTAAREILGAYQKSIRNGGTSSDALDAMTKTINSQMQAGVFISGHLKDDALDFRNWDMNAVERTTFGQSAKAVGASNVLPEGVPTHVHVEFPDGL